MAVASPVVGPKAFALVSKGPAGVVNRALVKGGLRVAPLMATTCRERGVHNQECCCPQCCMLLPFRDGLQGCQFAGGLALLTVVT